MAVIEKVVCERCGVEGTVEEGDGLLGMGVMKKSFLPEGWEKLDGREICQSCAAKYREILTLFFQQQVINKNQTE